MHPAVCVNARARRSILISLINNLIRLFNPSRSTLLAINIQISMAIILLHCKRQCIKAHTLSGTTAEHAYRLFIAVTHRVNHD